MALIDVQLRKLDEPTFIVTTISIDPNTCKKDNLLVLKKPDPEYSTETYLMTNFVVGVDVTTNVPYYVLYILPYEVGDSNFAGDFIGGQPR